MKTQLDFLREAVALAEQNPEMKIYIASSDEHCGDKAWTRHQITKIKKTLYCCFEEEIFLDTAAVMDYFDYLDEEITEEQAKAKMEEVILIYTAP